MNKLTLSNFKAFEGDFEILLSNKKNLLLYGENGAGKSSIYEAIRVVFFKSRIESALTAKTPEDLEQLKKETWGDYNNSINGQDFNIKVNDTDYKSFSIDPYQVFMISIEEMEFGGKIKLEQILTAFCFSMEDIHQFCVTHYQSIQTEVNTALDSFKETVRIEIDEQDDYFIKVIDLPRKLERKSNLKKYFNEAKLNLILLLLLLNSIIKAKEGTKSKILVLDDFITSLDVSNRTFLIQYIFSKFNDSQILIFTHNISFYNLIMHIIKHIDETANKWEIGNLFEINNVHRLYLKSGIDKVENIKDAYQNLANPTTLEIESIGNRIRKRFEVLLYEYSKLFMIGAVEESKNILAKISNGEGTYFHQGKTSMHLLDKIQQILNENNPNNLSGRIQLEINNYRYEPFSNFRKILNDLKLYQKVTMHPMSHGVSGLNSFTLKEIEKSLDLLSKMEKYLKDLADDNISNS